MLKNIIRISLIYFFVVSFSFKMYSQTIKRFHQEQFDFINKRMNAQVRSDIFNDFAWLAPDIKATKILFEENFFFFTLNSAGFQIHVFDSSLLEFKGKANSLLISKEVSRNNIYYNKNLLTKKAVIAQKWTTSTLTNTPKINWNWGTSVDSNLTIPSYQYYPFLLHDSTLLYLYEVPDSMGNKSYYLQNASYILATDGNGIKYILLDANCNGSYTDSNDKILFNTWNPYSKESRFRKIKFLKENFWYSQSYLSKEFFLTANFALGKFSIISENNLSETSKIGSIILTKIPKDAILFINDTCYQLNKRKITFNCEYGKYNARFFVKGYEDFETTFIINDANKQKEISYPKKTPIAATVIIKNIFASDFIITVKNASGYSQTYNNISTFSIPIGYNELEIYCDGSILNHSFTAIKSETYEVDFGAEITKVK